MTMGSVARDHEVARKTLHLTTAVVPLALATGLVSQRIVAVGLLVLMAIALVVEWLRRRSRMVSRLFRDTVGHMLREHERSRALTGATYLIATFALVAIAVPTPIAIAALWAGSVGDAAAAIAGRAWSRRARTTGKTLAGSLACAASTSVGAWWLAAMLPMHAVALGVVAAAVERPQLALDDNVRVTAAVAITGLLLSAL
jgi:phytol kinase